MIIHTMLYAAICSLILFLLSTNVIKQRRKADSIDPKNKNELNRRIRAQGNFAEYTPFFLILLFIYELNGAPAYMIHIFGIAFLISRIMHAYGLLIHEKYDDNGSLTTNPKWRVRGMIGTFTMIITLSSFLLIKYFLVVF